MFKKIIVCFFLVNFLFVSINIVKAKQSDDFLYFLSKKIYNDCQEKNLVLKENSLFDLRKGISLWTLDEYIKTWPNYKQADIREILSIFSSREPYSKFVIINGKKELIGTVAKFTQTFNDGVERTIVNHGYALLKCGENVLDINGVDYYWNNEKIVLPTNTFVSVDKLSQNYFTLFGVSLISKGGFVVFGFSIIGFLGVIFFVIKKSYYWFFKKEIKIKYFKEKK